MDLKNYILYLICVSLLFFFLLFSVKMFERKNNIINSKVYALVNNYENVEKRDKKGNVNVSYPKFNYKVLDEEIIEFINQYSKENVSIQYSISVNRNIISIFFVINSEGKERYENINYSIKDSKFINKNDVFDFNILGNEVLEKVKVKYSNYIYERVVVDNFKSAFLKVVDDGIFIYFDNSLFENILHKVYVFFPNTEEDAVLTTNYDKVIAFTFDDGPSQYTASLVDALIANDSKATFFELGNRMKYNQDIVREIYNRGMEVASHTYAHKNLNKLSESEVDDEINSTNIIFNEITGGNIGYLRPPYGNANDKVKSRVNMPIITWSVDTEDWLSRNSEAIYNHILEHVNDGDIVLMHDIYPETVEAVKMVLPVLKERGYKVTTVSELAREKGKTLENGHIYRSMK